MERKPRRLDGWPPAAGNQPSTTRVDDSKRPREDPARRGEQVRPGRRAGLTCIARLKLVLSTGFSVNGAHR